MPERFAPTHEALFRAGIENPALQVGLWLLAWPVRLGMVRDLSKAAGLVRTVGEWFEACGTDRGGLVAEAWGAGEDGRPEAARWAIWADPGAGPNVPAAPAAAILAGLASGTLDMSGARSCAGQLSVEAITSQLAHLPIHVRLDRARPSDPSLMMRMLGRGAGALPPEIQRLHAGLAPASFRGRGRARGARSFPAAAVRAILGLPAPGDYPDLEVSIAPHGQTEIWTRRFGRRSFTSRLSSVGDPGRFEEGFGPIRFCLEAEVFDAGFRWRFTGWRLWRLPLPNWAAPQIRAVTFADAKGYRFHVAVAHSLTGLVFAYAGRLA